MSRVIRVSLQNCEGAVDLLEHDNSREFVGERHLSQ